MTRIKVAVTGASGRTGRLVVQRLLLEPDRYEPVALVRSRKAADDLERLFARAAAAARKGEQAAAAGDSNAPAPPFSAGAVHIVDFCEGLTPQTPEEEPESSSSTATTTTDAKLRAAFAGCRALVVASSAVAEPKAWASIVSAAQVASARLAARLTGRATTGIAPFVPVATWKGGQAPREVDWLGARRLFRAFFAAVAAEGGDNSGGHVVLISSAGGCDPRHFLNRIARGEILNWKRRAEQELVRMCGASGGKGGKGGAAKPVVVTYSILHPNHLIDRPPGPPAGALPTKPGDFFDPSRSRLLLAVDDALQEPHWSRRPRVPRAALAELAAQCVALARPAGGSGGGWCEWEEEEEAGGAPDALPAPARNRSVDVGVEAVRPAAADAAAPASSSSPALMTQLFASLLRGMPGDCDYGINDRTSAGGEQQQQWACE